MTAHTETVYDIMPVERKTDAGDAFDQNINLKNTFQPAPIGEDSDAIRPDPGSEKFFIVENNRFAFTPGQLNKLLSPKSLPAFRALGGVCGLERGLRTDISAGLNIDENLVGNVSFQDALRPSTATEPDTPAIDRAPTSNSLVTSSSIAFAERKRIFGDNSLPSKTGKSIFRLMWEQYNDKILILLSFAAVVSLALGLYETFRNVRDEAPETNSSEHEPQGVDWIEGVAIVIAIVIVVLVGSLNDWQKERQFVKLNAKVCLITVDTIRWLLIFLLERGSRC